MKVSQLLLIIVLSLAACASVAAQVEPDDGGNPLADTEWVLTSMSVRGSTSGFIEDSKITLKFGSTERAGGTGGCNTFGADYRASGNGISFSRIISTKRACLDPRSNELEQLYFRGLELVIRVEISEDGMSLFLPGREGRLTFRRTSAWTPEQQRYEDLTHPVSLLASFYNAVNLRDYARAHRYWETPPSQLEEFRGGYRETLNVRLIVKPPTKFEGEAGNLFAEVPTVIVVLQRNGRERIFAGCYVTRQANRGPIAGSGDWRILRGTLSPAAASASIPRLLAQACRN